MRFSVERLLRRPFAPLAGPYPLQRAHVGAGTEAATGASQHDDAHLWVVARRAHCRLHLGMHDRRPGVQPLRPIEGDDRNPILDPVQNLGISHRALPHFFSHWA